MKASLINVGMNYHLMIDAIFIDEFINDAEMVAPGKNIFIFTFPPPTKYVKSTKGIFAPYGSSVLKNIVEKITIEDRVFVHWFHDAVMQVIDKINAATPVYLFFWGGDFLEQQKYLDDFNFDTLTKRYIKENKSIDLFYWMKDPLNYVRMFKNPIYYLRILSAYVLSITKPSKSNDNKFAIRKRFLDRLNYFCHWNILDLDIIREIYECSPSFMDFSYRSGGFEKTETIKKTINACTKIWLGNSDTETNNHLDAIEALSAYNNNDLKIICPLSYGNKKYGDFVSLEGQRVFKTKWHSIRNFMTIDKYLEVLNDVDIAVMYHNRTQAAGNISAFIKLGKKVYIKKHYQTTKV